MGILDTAKDVITLVQKADNLELVKQVLALQSDIMKMMDENRTLKDENYYWLPKEDGTEDGPFCSACQDGDHKLVRATEGATRGHYYCQVCLAKRSKGR